MLQLATKLGLSATPQTWLCKIFPKFCSKFGLYQLSGTADRKHIKIFTFKERKSPTRYIVAQTPIEYHCPDLQIFIKRKPFLWNFQKVLDPNFTTINDPILDGKITISSNDKALSRKIFSYEEICEEMYQVWPTRNSPGTLLISSNFITYHEPARMVRSVNRNRIAHATKLICDISDVVKLTVPHQHPSQ